MIVLRTIYFADHTSSQYQRWQFHRNARLIFLGGCNDSHLTEMYYQATSSCFSAVKYEWNKEMMVPADLNRERSQKSNQETTKIPNENL